MGKKGCIAGDIPGKLSGMNAATAVSSWPRRKVRSRSVFRCAASKILWQTSLPAGRLRTSPLPPAHRSPETIPHGSPYRSCGYECRTKGHEAGRAGSNIPAPAQDPARLFPCGCARLPPEYSKWCGAHRRFRGNSTPYFPQRAAREQGGAEYLLSQNHILRHNYNMGRDYLASYTKVAVCDRTVIPIRFHPQQGGHPS